MKKIALSLHVLMLLNFEVCFADKAGIVHLKKSGNNTYVQRYQVKNQTASYTTCSGIQGKDSVSNIEFIEQPEICAMTNAKAFDEFLTKVTAVAAKMSKVNRIVVSVPPEQNFSEAKEKVLRSLQGRNLKVRQANILHVAIEGTPPPELVGFQKSWDHKSGPTKIDASGMIEIIPTRQD